MTDPNTPYDSQLLLRAGLLARSRQMASVGENGSEALESFVAILTAAIGLEEPELIAPALAQAEVKMGAAGLTAPIDRISYFAGLSQTERDLVTVLAAMRVARDRGYPVPQGENGAVGIEFAQEVVGLRSGVESIFDAEGALYDYGVIAKHGGPGRADSFVQLRTHALAQLRGIRACSPELEDAESALPEALPFGLDLPPALTRSDFLYVRGATAGLALYRIAQLLESDGRNDARWLDLRKAGEEDDAARRLRIACLDAFVNGTTLVVGPITQLAESSPLLLRGLQDPRASVAIFGTVPWEHAYLGFDPYCWEAPRLDEAEAAMLWEGALGERAGEEVIAGLRHLPLQPEQIRESARVIDLETGEREGGVETGEIIGAIRSVSFERLGTLARRVSPKVSWEDLLLPDNVTRQLRWMCDRYRHRHLVAREWRLKPGGGRGVGVSALFTGDSGTGKTLAAEVAAAELGLEMLVVDLSSLVDKYVGETEKNLERVFSVVENAPGLLFFDEADAVFGKRSEVKESNDRFANVQVSYLLQRLEAFNGLAILSSNLKANIDQAFMRRLDLAIDFPMPDIEMRARLWREFLGSVPIEDDIEWDFLASNFEMPGGNIRAATLSAAYLAAAESRKVGMRDLMVGLVLEYRKLGHLLSESEFAHWSALVKWV